MMRCFQRCTFTAEATLRNRRPTEAGGATTSSVANSIATHKEEDEEEELLASSLAANDMNIAVCDASGNRILTADVISELLASVDAL
jgi:hypothetical protein